MSDETKIMSRKRWKRALAMQRQRYAGEPSAESLADLDALDAHDLALRRQLARAVEALRGVIREADRDTDPFIRARAVLAEHDNESPQPRRGAVGDSGDAFFPCDTLQADSGVTPRRDEDQSTQEASPGKERAPGPGAKGSATACPHCDDTECCYNQSTNGAQAPGVGGAAETGASVRVGASGDAGPNRLEQVQLLPLDTPLVDPSPPGAVCECGCSRSEHVGLRGECRCNQCGGYEPAPPTTEALKTCPSCGFLMIGTPGCAPGDCVMRRPFAGPGPTRYELVEALRELVMVLHCRTVHIGHECNRYEATYAVSVDDPVKLARALLARCDADKREGER